MAVSDEVIPEIDRDTNPERRSIARAGQEHTSIGKTPGATLGLTVVGADCRRFWWRHGTTHGSDRAEHSAAWCWVLPTLQLRAGAWLESTVVVDEGVTT